MLLEMSCATPLCQGFGKRPGKDFRKPPEGNRSKCSGLESVRSLGEGFERPVGPGSGKFVGQGFERSVGPGSGKFVGRNSVSLADEGFENPVGRNSASLVVPNFLHRAARNFETLPEQNFPGVLEEDCRQFPRLPVAAVPRRAKTGRRKTVGYRRPLLQSPWVRSIAHRRTWKCHPLVALVLRVMVDRRSDPS